MIGWCNGLRCCLSSDLNRPRPFGYVCSVVLSFLKAAATDTVHAAGSGRRAITAGEAVTPEKKERMNVCALLKSSGQIQLNLTTVAKDKAG